MSESSHSPLFTPPRFFERVPFHRHTARSIGWLELFYDLVYVATLIQIGNFLSDNVSLLGFAQFCVMLVVVWWAWSGETFYQNRYVVDDLLHRLLVFVQMFGVAIIGLSVSEAFGELYVQFTVGYIITRLMLVLMYIRTIRQTEDHKALNKVYVRGFCIGLLIWIGSLALPAEYHWVGWLLGITAELTVPLQPHVRKLQRLAAIDVHHISERFGIFTIIVLGEAFVKVLDDAQGTQLGLEQILFSASGLTVLYALWWLYFSDTADHSIDFQHPVKPFAWLYGHAPLAASLITFGVGAKKLFSETINYPGEPLNPDYRILYTVAIVLYLIALALIDFGLDDDETYAKQNREAIVHILGAVVVAIFGLTMTGISATGFVSLVALVMLAQVGYSIYISQQQERSLHQQEAAHS